MTATAAFNRRLLKPRSGNSYRGCPKGWMVQPKVNDHRVAILMNPDGDMMVFNNEGTLYSKMWWRDTAHMDVFKSMLMDFFTEHFNADGEWPWLVDAGVMGPAYGKGPATLIIHDIPRSKDIMKKRYAILADWFPLWMINEDNHEPMYGNIMVTPTWDKSVMPVMWKHMQDQNTKLGYNCYEGFVCKDPLSKYPFTTSKRKFPKWIKYRFDQLN